jgi:hypothetical protein
VQQEVAGEDRGGVSEQGAPAASAPLRRPRMRNSPATFGMPRRTVSWSITSSWTTKAVCSRLEGGPPPDKRTASVRDHRTPRRCRDERGGRAACRRSRTCDRIRRVPRSRPQLARASAMRAVTVDRLVDGRYVVASGIMTPRRRCRGRLGVEERCSCSACSTSHGLNGPRRGSQRGAEVHEDRPTWLRRPRVD